MNFIISFEMCSTRKLSKYVTFSAFRHNAIHSIPIDLYLSRFISYAQSFVLGKLFLD